MPAHLHTANLYKFDDVVSALQKCIRRGEAAQALFWAGELEQGFEYILYSRLWTIVAEDIGLAAPYLALELFPLYQEWVKVHKTNPEKGKEITLQIVYTLAKAPKNRIVDNLFLYTYFQPKPSVTWTAQQPSQALQEKIQLLFSVNLFAAQEEKEIDLQAALLQLAACLEARDVENAFFFCNFINLSTEESTHTPWLHQYLELPNTIKIDSKTAKKVGVYNWYVLFELSKGNPQLWNLLKVLYQLYIAKVGSPVLLMTFAVLLCCYQEKLKTTPVSSNLLEVPKAMQDCYYNNGTTITERRKLSIPDYAIDKHTDRGKGSPYAPHNIADLHTEAQKKRIPTHAWSTEEIAKSHGAYKKFADYKQAGQHSRMSHFFTEGALLNNVPASWLGEDPYEEGVLRYFLTLEKKYGYKACSGFFIYEKMRPIWIANQTLWKK